MSQTAVVPQIMFTVKVDISTTPPTFIIYDDKGAPTTAPIEVSVTGTKIIYTLIDNVQDLIFVGPDIKYDSHHDLSPVISDDGQTLTITDSDNDDESICLKLVVATSSDPDTTYPSPDPLIKNRPPQ